MGDAKIAMITGGSRGLGFATADALHAKGWQVVIVSRNQEDLDQAADRIGRDRVLPLRCDVSDPRDVERVVSKVRNTFGPITAVINNAGVIEPAGDVAEIDAESWMQAMKINVGGALNTTRYVLPEMKRAGSGIILNLTTGLAHMASKGLSAYCASKSALSMLSKCLQEECEGSGIKVFEFTPGAVSTDMVKISLNYVNLGEGQKVWPPEHPAACIAWIIENSDILSSEDELSFKDPELRKRAGINGINDT